MNGKPFAWLLYISYYSTNFHYCCFQLLVMPFEFAPEDALTTPTIMRSAQILPIQIGIQAAPKPPCSFPSSRTITRGGIIVTIIGTERHVVLISEGVSCISTVSSNSKAKVIGGVRNLEEHCYQLYSIYVHIYYFWTTEKTQTLYLSCNNILCLERFTFYITYRKL